MIILAGVMEWYQSSEIPVPGKHYGDCDTGLGNGNSHKESNPMLQLAFRAVGILQRVCYKATAEDCLQVNQTKCQNC